jgi:ribosome-binding factor A
VRSDRKRSRRIAVDPAVLPDSRSVVMAKKPFRKVRGGESPGDAGRPDRKTLQLCEQVRQALEYALSGESNDDLLRMLYVARVEPAPDADRLMVTVVPLTKDEHPDPADVMTRLHDHSGSLRSSVASAISRRKVPDLIYRYADSDPLADEEE